MKNSEIRKMPILALGSLAVGMSSCVTDGLTFAYEREIKGVPLIIGYDRGNVAITAKLPPRPSVGKEPIK
jgi:hypothetical protein